MTDHYYRCLVGVIMQPFQRNIALPCKRMHLGAGTGGQGDERHRVGGLWRRRATGKAVGRWQARLTKEERGGEAGSGAGTRGWESGRRGSKPRAYSIYSTATRVRLIAFFVKVYEPVHNPWSYYSYISKYSTLYLVPFPLNRTCISTSACDAQTHTLSGWQQRKWQNWQHCSQHSSHWPISIHNHLIEIWVTYH